VRKTYRAACAGSVVGDSGVLEQWLWKESVKNRVHVRAEGDARAKPAVTAWRVLARTPERVLLELEPRTGRPHQLRVACASLGAPIAGDLKYGAPAGLPDRSIALHAARLELVHPVRRTPLTLAAPEPRDGPAGSVWRFPADSATAG
jgi:23S rRNA pseudouridine1911/1915/1917 synthase